MRELRPEYYSDTTAKISYLLDAPTFEYHLDTITARNQTHDFEIFCRKLCERVICPNLRPATGPEGGGDSKADTETYSVAEEIATLTYVGHPSAGKERWAFAFSAKKTWASKVEADVAGIIETKRDYKKIICVTSQFARAKARATLEDRLSKQYGIEITIHDRSWIVEEIIDKERKHLAVNYLGVGQEIKNTIRLGPTDYSRTQQLEDIEKSFDDPEAYTGMEIQRVTEALLAAKLSRNLERPRSDTEGRFMRAIRLANQDGTPRQQLSALYESIWTAFWWFDDIRSMNMNYDELEKLVIDSSKAKNLELLCNLAQLLFNSVIHHHLSVDEAKLYQRVSRLVERLTVLAADEERPNNALEAQTSLLILKLNQAHLDGNQIEVSSIWSQFSDVVKKAKNLGEYDVEKLKELIEVFGIVAGNDPAYSRLIDDVADLVTNRTGEAQGALILLKRAQQLDSNSNFEIIRLLGKAVNQLSKKEYIDSLIEALQLLALTYRSAGLLWASRACCYFLIASIFIEAEESSDLPASVVPNLMLLGWVTLELRHLPDILETITLILGCTSSLPLDDSSKERVYTRLNDFDIVLASYILNFTSEHLQITSNLPDIFESLGLIHSRNSLLYCLGHEKQLRSERCIPEDETSENVIEFFNTLASQPSALDLPRTPLFNEHGTSQCLTSKIQGMTVEVVHSTTDASILVAEVIISSLEALYATTLDLDVAAHTEIFTISINENSNLQEPEYKINLDIMNAKVEWPNRLFPHSYQRQPEIIRFLITLASDIFTSTCYGRDIGETVIKLFESESLMDRIGMIVFSAASRQRILDTPVSRLQTWNSRNPIKYTLESDRPEIERKKLSKDNEKNIKTSKLNSEKYELPKDHRDLNVRSIIDIHLWDSAGWSGTGFIYHPDKPPVIGLLFKNKEAAIKIFSRWKERFGEDDKKDEIYIAIVRGISDKHPSHYRVLITSGFSEESDPKNQVFMQSSRMNTMEPNTDENLMRFLAALQRYKCYFLMPAFLNANNTPEFLGEFVFLKRKLSIKTVADIERTDVEVMALGREGFIKKFGDDA